MSAAADEPLALSDVLSDPVSSARSRIRLSRLVAVLRLRTPARAVEICETLLHEGLDVMEITLDHPDSLDAIARVRAALGREALLGAGTVLAAEAVSAAASAGAEFCVSPHLDPAIIAAAQDRRMLAIPGVFSPTEIVAARRSGVSMLKLFPAEPVGPSYVTALRGPFPDVGLVPTGGIENGMIAAWLEAGAVAVGVGSALVDRSGTIDGLAERARRIRSLAPPLL